MKTVLIALAAVFNRVLWGFFIGSMAVGFAFFAAQAYLIVIGQ